MFLVNEKCFRFDSFCPVGVVLQKTLYYKFTVVFLRSPFLCHYLCFWQIIYYIRKKKRRLDYEEVSRSLEPWIENESKVNLKDRTEPEERAEFRSWGEVRGAVIEKQTQSHWKLGIKTLLRQKRRTWGERTTWCQRRSVFKCKVMVLPLMSVQLCGWRAL